MSDYETRKGKLIKIDTDLSIKEFIKDKVGEVLPKYYNSFEEYFKYEFSEQYIIHNGNIYEIVDERLDDYEDIFHYEIKNENEIEYLFRYYNGGTCLREQIDIMLERINK